ncbi:type III-B CRISPR module RAMP protein Cmr6 [Nocardiopsis sp. LOL_012]|uniref:type III-B CRISPR module RAMP protein Cmr6 n=1 Tax=Nocardiopsis sp. LOL_012 TaxID=3345409 RepID=UPI003A8A07C4
MLKVEHTPSATGEPTSVLQETAHGSGRGVGPEANALVILRRLSFEPVDGGTNPWKNHVPLHGWATEHRLGQGGSGLQNAVLQRRRHFLRRWAAFDPDRRHVRRLRLTVEWRMASGLGLQFGVLDNGLALHGTYGWPGLPASTLKGLAAAGARSAGADTERIVRALGGPRPRGDQDPRPTTEEHTRGTVRFLDALPDAVTVHDDVITPHQQPYYTSTDPKAHKDAQTKRNARPPAEHHNPVPVPFLSVSGRMHVDLIGDDGGDLDAVSAWLAEAGEELGGGGRTTAGYGYFDCSTVDEEDA